MKVLTVIPCRMNASRLPGKPLLNILGKPLIQHVYEGVKSAKKVDKFIVATDSQEILNCVAGFGGEAIITSAKHNTGTERVAEVAAKFSGYEIVLNVQGDEPLVTGEMLDQLATPLINNPKIHMTALKGRLTNIEDINDPSIVKVVTNSQNIALYYSRLPIPYPRHKTDCYYRNKGIYGFRRSFLLEFPNLPCGPLELAESLEQLRALENGKQIYVSQTDVITHGVNTPADVPVVEKALREKLRNTVTKP
ncbi:MAG: 3-deoxy-manno-octulosonate cytidylyltransferase [Magnetococcales bacterium]|nr:3-deoxy-manno-octulosonate cytidylyltransferase [Magnetococcales bacterium]